MNQSFDPAIFVPVGRAQSYPHTWPPETSDPDAAIVDLDSTSLVVEVESVEIGVVTLAASTEHAESDAYGQEYDIDPASARVLGLQLTAAAELARRNGREVAPEPVEPDAKGAFNGS